MKKKRTMASQAAASGLLPEPPEGLLDDLVKGPMSPADVQDLILAFNYALMERATGAEMASNTEHGSFAWEHITPFFACLPGYPSLAHTTNATESLNMQLREIIKTRVQLPNDEAAIKLL